MRSAVVCAASLAVVLATVSATGSERAYVSVHSPLTSSSGSWDVAAPVAVRDALAFVYAGVFGVSSYWSPAGAVASLPTTDPFVRPRAGMIVSAPGVPVSGLSGAAEVTLDGTAPLLEDETLNVCGKETVTVGSQHATLMWSDKVSAFESYSPSVSGVPACAPESLSLLAAINAPVTLTDTGCTVTINGHTLDSNKPGVSRVLAEVATLLSLSSSLSLPSPACPALLHLAFAGHTEVLGEDVDAASALVSAAITKAASNVDAAFPSRSAVAVFTSPLTAAPRALQVSSSPSAGPVPSGAPTGAQIARYQIVLWTGVSLALALLAAVCALVFMDLGRDPVLYNQFKTDSDKRD